MAGFFRLLQGLMEDSRRMGVVELIDAVLERTGYREYLFGRDERAEERWDNIVELRNTAQEFHGMEPPEGLTLLLERLALVADVDTYEESPDSLTLITLHQAKGPGVSCGLYGGHGGGPPAPQPLHGQRGRAGGRAEALLRGHDPFQGAALPAEGLSTGATPALTAPSGPSRFLYEIPSHLTTPATPAAPARKSAAEIWEPLVAVVRP